MQLHCFDGYRQFFRDGFGAVPVQYQVDYLGFPLREQAAAKCVQGRMQLRPQVDCRGLTAAARPVLLAQGFHRGADSLENGQFGFGKTGSGRGFAQRDIHEALFTNLDQIAAFILVTAIPIPGLVVFAVPKTAGRQVAQAKYPELPFPGGGQVIGVQQKSALHKHIQCG